MCAIIDANVAAGVFGPHSGQAGEKFFDWINTGRGRLVVDGKLLEELEASSQGFREWAREAVSAGRMRIVNSSEIDARTERVQHERTYRSDDPHVIALAQVSGARLLYSNDADLQRDFKDKNLIDSPRGKVYSTLHNENFQDSHRRLLGNRSLCRSEQ